jgi:hypothetical protein
MRNAIPAKFKLVSALAFTITCATSAHAFTGNIGSNATIVSPISFTQGAPLEFGAILTSASAGTVSIAATAAGTATSGGGATAMANGGITPTAAKLNISGSGDFAYSLSVPPSVTLNGPGQPMTASLSPDGTPSSLVNGTSTRYIGGTISVGANQTGGAYSGNFSVTVDYQ